MITKLQCYPLISEEGNLSYVTTESGKVLFEVLLPSDDVLKTPHANEDGGLQAAIDRLNAYKRDHGLS